MKKRAEKEKKEAKKRKREREKTLGNTNFSPEVDAVSGASIMKDGDDIIGNIQMLAYMTQNATGCDIAAIHTEKPYPKDWGIKYSFYVNSPLSHLKGFLNEFVYSLRIS